MPKKDDRQWTYVVNTQTDVISRFGFTREGLEAFLARHPHMKALVQFKAYGCYLTVTGFRNKPVLLCAPMLIDGSCDRQPGAIGEVTAPETQEFLDAVNKVFGTKFVLSQFAGR